MTRFGTWSAADEAGISSLWLSDPLRATLKGKRLRRALDAPTLKPGVLPAPWQQVLRGWLRKASATTFMKWESLYTRGNKVPANAVEPLFQVLMQHGELELKERRAPHGWQREAVRFTDPSRLRRELGIPEPDEAANELAERRAIEYAHPALDVARQGLDGTSPRTALARLELLDALQKWHDAGRNRGHATRRDFALFSRGSTKGITPAEWRWLEEQLDLASLGIAVHSPLLLIAAHCSLVWPHGTLDLAAIPGFIGLPAATLASIEAIQSPPRQWRLLENRTAFEKVVTSRPVDDAVVWLPGYPPSWWRDAMSRFLKLAPAAAMIACDPDPDGIAIALQAGALWSAADLEWSPWKMSATELEGLGHRRDISQRDRERLDAIAPLLHERPELAELAQWIAEHGEKGEQEGLFD